jgi:hypothetical protein
VSFALQTVETVPDIIPLTATERALKTELEIIIRANFAAFMQVGEALAQIRQRRLFRDRYITFSDYVKGEFGMMPSTANGLLRSAELAQQLVDDGIQLPADTLPSALKALTGIPPLEGLRTACWQYAQSLSPARSPSSTMVSRVVRLIRFELDDAISDEEDSDEDSGREGYQRGPKKPPSESLPAREQPFLRPATRLATFTQFSPELVVSSINQPANALTAYRVCDTLVERLRLVQQCLEQSFPNAFDSSTAQCRAKEAITQDCLAGEPTG